MSIKMKQTTNFKAGELKEAKKMVTLFSKEEDKIKSINVTDFIFNDDNTLKEIKSELSKDELKKAMDKLIDMYYDSYRK